MLPPPSKPHRSHTPFRGSCSQGGGPPNFVRPSFPFTRGSADAYSPPTPCLMCSIRARPPLHSSPHFSASQTASALGTLSCLSPSRAREVTAHLVSSADSMDPDLGRDYPPVSNRCPTVLIADVCAARFDSPCTLSPIILLFF